MDRIEGRTAFVTGAASGIGLAITEALVASGARVAMTDWDESALNTQATRFGDAVASRRLDVRDRDEWSETARWVETTFGPVEILVNNAGIGPTIGSVAETTPDSFDQMIDIKLTGTFNGIHTFAMGMRDRGSGHIVNTASMAGLIASPQLGAYTAAKFGVVGLSEVLRAELARYGVGVSVLCPGMVRTNLAANAALATNAPEDRDVSMADGIEASFVGDQVVAAIGNDTPYIVTHPEHRAMVAARGDRLLRAFDEEDVRREAF